VRIWGTVGWVLSGLSLSMWLGRADVSAWLVAQFPSLQPRIDTLGATFAWIGPPSSSDCFRIAAVLSFLLSSFCIFLPTTPPAREHEGALAPIETLKMFRNRTFAMLIGVSFILAMVVPFYSIAVPKLLQQMGFASQWVPAVMTIGQISEFPALLLLPWFLKRYGLKTTFAFGMAAWLLRYVLFALQPSTGLVLAGIGLHGVCHVFLIIVIQLYVDSQCRQDLRASAQNLFAFITMGIAMPVGFWVAGMLGNYVTVERTDAATGQIIQQTDYGLFFAIPAAVIAVLLPAYWRWVRLDDAGKADSGERKADSAGGASTEAESRLGDVTDAGESV
jgi:Na+/melibiose symporter-like transporter